LTNSITPPPELVARWKDYWFDAKIKHINLEDYILAQAAQWGADQELDACCKWLGPLGIKGGDNLRRARRPKPPSLKEQAIAVLEDAGVNAAHYNILLRALEQLND